MSEFILVVTEFYTLDTDAFAHRAVVSKQAGNRWSSASYLIVCYRLLYTPLASEALRPTAAYFSRVRRLLQNILKPLTVSRGSYVLCALV